MNLTPSALLRWQRTLGCALAASIIWGTALGAAGRTEGRFAVSADGAALYSIPIWTPPGVRGIEPHLSLSYSSRNGDGLIGPGWTVSGLSAITRCKMSWAQDGLPTAISLTTADRFCLDGVRLRATSPGTYGQDGMTYQTEIANFANIISHGLGPDWFEVQLKDGRTLELGRTQDDEQNSTGAQILATGTSTPYVWALSAMKDRYANRMAITYSQSNGSFTPLSIRYTKTAVSNAYHYRVDFDYVSRDSNNQLIEFIAGSEIQLSTRLKKIRVSSLDNPAQQLRQYILEYANSPTTAKTRLFSVQECAGSLGNVCLPQTTILYQDGQIGFASSSISSGASTNASLPTYAVDIDGDGRSDLLYATQTGAPPTSFHWWARLASGSGFGAQLDTHINVSPSFANVAVDDLLGEGRTGILARSGTSWLYYRWNGTDFVSQSTGVDSALGLATADVNGDGLPDLIYGRTDHFLYTRLNTSSGGVVSFSTSETQAYNVAALGFPNGGTPLGSNAFPNSAVHHYDFNGDGRGDLFLLINTGSGFSFYVTLLAQGPVNAPTLTTGYNGGATVIPVDWNGDRCTDVAIPANGLLSVQNCNGGNGFNIAIPSTSFVALDYDGDGLMDLLGGSGAVLSSGGSIKATVPMTSGGNLPLDQDGDGLDDVASVSLGTPITVALHNGAGQKPDLVSSITDGFGVNFSPTYTSIAALGAPYTRASSSAWPDPELMYPIQVVSSFHASYALALSFTRTFTYTGARYSTRGRGFEGFEYTENTDSRDHILRRTRFRQDFPFTGLPSEDYAFQPQSGPSIFSTLYTYTTLAEAQLDSTFHNERYFPYAKTSVRTDAEVTSGIGNGSPITKTTVTRSFDSYGNPTLERVERQDLDAGGGGPFLNQIWKTEVTKGYAPDVAHWCVGIPVDTTVTNTLPSGSAQTRHATNTPAQIDYVKCIVQQQVVEPNNLPYTVTTGLGYDSCGNVSSVTLTGTKPDNSPMQARVTGIHYDGRCQFPDSVTNALNQTTTLHYRYEFGELESSTDPNGLQTSWQYDDFGRVQQMKNPDQTGTNFTYTACDSSNSNCGDLNRKMQIQAQAFDDLGAAVNTAVTYLDLFGRVKRVESPLAFGGQSIVNYDYDWLGRLQSETIPSNSGGPHNFWHDYDLLGRELRVTRAIQALNAVQQITTQYQGRRTIVTDPKGAVTTTISDVAGRVRQIIDPSPGGTTLYDYDPFGNLVSTTDAIGSTTTWDYNIRGFRTSMSDPDKGNWSYVPNSLGELSSQTNARLQTVSFSYDNLGRPLTRDDQPEGHTQWIWDTAPGAGIGRLAQVSSPGGYSESYIYDSLGRPKFVQYSEDRVYQYDFTYNGIGELEDITYPVSNGKYRLKIRNEYTNGFLTRTRDLASGTVFWQSNAMDAFGNATDESFGNGVRTVSTFDPSTGWIATTHSGTDAGATNVQDYSYHWDINGNLHDRNDNIQSLQEVFTYDNLNRLASSALNGTPNLAVGLDASGNITSKSGVGTYNYFPARKHLLSQVVSGSQTNTYGYDNNGNMTSRPDGTVVWTSYDLPSSITAGSLSAQLSYGADRQRWKQVANYADGPQTTVYIGGLMEKVRTPNGIGYRHFIPAGSGGVIYTRWCDGNGNTFYVSTDHLGSTSTISCGPGVANCSSGTVFLRESFDAYGARRGSAWSGTASGDALKISQTLRDGFTGHEMLDSVSLIHMGGRVYDPLLGRFLSGDPIDHRFDTQLANRYSYVVNNPLTYTDPSGFEPGSCAGNEPCEGVGVDWIIQNDPSATIVSLNGASFDNGWIIFPTHVESCLDISCDFDVNSLWPKYVGFQGFIGLGDTLRTFETSNLWFASNPEGQAWNGVLETIAGVADWLVTPGRSPGDKALNMVGSAVGVQAAICLFDSGTPSQCAAPVARAAAAGFVLSVIPGGKGVGSAERGAGVLEELGTVSGSTRASAIRIGPRWRARAITDQACRTGCERVASQIQRIIGGERKRIEPMEGGLLGAYRGVNLGWSHHEVVVKGGRVYDAFTGYGGATISEYKALWQYADAINFGF